MTEHTYEKLISAIFITFSGNCKQALKFYQTCFGGLLQFDLFEKELKGYSGTPVVSGYLVSDKVVIRGSDLVHNEGRKLGNYIAVYLHCKNFHDRDELVQKLEVGKAQRFIKQNEEPKLIEITDAFGVRWVLGV